MPRGADRLPGPRAARLPRADRRSENLDLYGRLYRRARAARARSARCSSGSGSGAVRNERAGTFSRGMLQRLALCRTFLHDPDLLLLDEPFDGLDVEGADAAADASSPSVDGRHGARRDPRSGGARLARDGKARARMSAYAGDVAALARKRPAARAAVAGHAAGDAAVRRLGARRSSTSRCPSGSVGARRDGPALDRDRLHRAPRLSRAPSSAEREQRLLDGLVAGAVRPQRDLARQDDRRHAASSSWPRSSRCPRSRSSSIRCRWELVAAVALADVGIARDRHAPRCDRGREPRTRAAAAAALPAARDPGRRSAASARASPRIPARYLAFLGLYDAVFAILSWASFEYVRY